MSQTLARCIAQHRALLAEAEEALAWEKRMHAENAALLDDMSRMRDAPAPLPQSSHTESDLLAALVRVTDRAFDDRRQCQQLRQVLDLLLNAVWDCPDDPYVSLRGLDTQVAAFLHQAGLVLAHPTEPDAVRLVAFHEALPDARTSRPTVYG